MIASFVSWQTVCFRRSGLERPTVMPSDRRRFEAELPNDLWQSDALHGPKVTEAGKLRQSYLFALIDDHSRLVLFAQEPIPHGMPSRVSRTASSRPSHGEACRESSTRTTARPSGATPCATPAVGWASRCCTPPRIPPRARERSSGCSRPCGSSSSRCCR